MRPAASTIRRHRTIGLGAALVAGLTLLVGCASAPTGGSAGPSGDTRQPTVITALYPLAYTAQSVAGAKANVSSLTTGGVEPHDLELDPQQVASLREADLVVYIPGLMPTLDEAVSGLRSDQVLDATSVVTLRGAPNPDPHLWLDPTALARVGTAIADRLTELSPASAEAYAAGSRDFAARMTDLDRAWRLGTTTCDRREIFVTHDAFGYLTDRYDLRGISILGRSPEQEPSAARLAEIADQMTKVGATTVFAEPAIGGAPTNPIAQTVATANGSQVATLDPLEIEPAQGDYATAMLANLDAVQQALGCAPAPQATS